MRAIEKIGLTKEVFKAMYEEYGKEETFLSFLKNGSESLVNEETELVVDIINKG